MKKIIILGGAGFVGKSLLKKLSAEKFHVKTMKHKVDAGIKTSKFKGDILSYGILGDEIEDGDTVINLIGQFDKDILKFINLNIIGGLNALNSCVKRKAVSIILISSISVYGENNDFPSKENDPTNPQTLYGIVKLLTEKIYEYYSKVYNMNVTVLRLSTLYGPNKKSGYIQELINSIKNKKSSVAYNNGRQLRDFLFIEDATNGIVNAIKNPQNGFIVFNISSGKRYMINDLIKIMEKISGKKLNVKMSSERHEEQCIWANNTKAKRILKFIPQTSIDEGLKITIEHFLKSPNT